MPHSWGMVSASKGTRPVKLSYRITPKAQMSVRMSTSRDELICSGDMYSGEPMIVWVLVMPNSGAAPGTVSFEIPKSSTLMHGLPSTRRVTNRFAG